MIRLRVSDITQHKCNSCANGRVSVYDSGRLETACNAGMNSATIPGTVLTCSQFRYAFEYAPSKMQDIGWVLEVKKGRVIGFKPPKAENED